MAGIVSTGIWSNAQQGQQGAQNPATHAITAHSLPLPS